MWKSNREDDAGGTCGQSRGQEFGDLVDEALGDRGMLAGLPLGLMPRWLVVVSYLVALGLLIASEVSMWLTLAFPPGCWSSVH